MEYAHYYAHGANKESVSLFFFHKSKALCLRLEVLGGNTYRQYGGWCWRASKKKELFAIAKLMQAEDVRREEMQKFIERMAEKERGM